MEASCLADLNVTPLENAKTEPPLTRSLSGPQLLAFLKNPLKTSLPGNSVAVERGVRDVTLAAAACSDGKERDGLIFQKKASREKNPRALRNRVYGP